MIAVIVVTTNGTVRMIMTILVERVDFGWRLHLPCVIHYNIYHQPHVSRLECVWKIAEFLSSAELGVESVEIFGPIPMLTFFEVEYYGWDPDCVKTHVADLVELGCKTLECTSAVICQVCTRIVDFIDICWLKSVCYYLLDCPCFPFFFWFWYY